jgi:hypothetical protein
MRAVRAQKAHVWRARSTACELSKINISGGCAREAIALRLAVLFICTLYESGRAKLARFREFFRFFFCEGWGGLGTGRDGPARPELEVGVGERCALLDSARSQPGRC